MNIELLIIKANKEMERLSKIASSDNPDPSPSDISMANEEYDLLEHLLDTHDYKLIRRISRARRGRVTVYPKTDGVRSTRLHSPACLECIDGLLSSHVWTTIQRLFTL